MPLITFQPSDVSINVEPGANLLEVAMSAGVEIVAPCGGKGTCGKCLVRIASGDVESNSLGILNAEELAEGYVLACRTTVSSTPLVVEVPEQIGRTDGKFTSAEEDSGLIREELFPHNWQYDPLAVKWRVSVAEPQLEDGLSDLDRLSRAIQHDWGKDEIAYSFEVIKKVADTIRQDAGMVTVTMIREPGRFHVIGIEAGNKTEQHYGLAIDIGTTTVAVQLVYLPDGGISGTQTDYNDQIACGLDIISRINYAAKKGNLEELRKRVLGTINKLIKKLEEMHHVGPRDIYNAVISGNTTMIHLLLGLTPEYIRLEPYTPTILQAPYLTAGEVGININPQSWVYLSPSVGSYVGGDIAAGILCTDLATSNEELSLFIDIGTNGEIVIGNSDFLMTCACSAGPAFEGGGIKCGMRAALGAIEQVEIEPATGKAACRTIGNVKPKGICGSGMISLLAKLLLTGWIDPAGKLDRSRPSEFIRIEDRTATYVIVPAKESDSGKAIVISEADFENIIRTKAAIYSACSLILKQLEMSFDDISNIYIAGGFGRFLDLEMSITIGLLPDLDRSKFKYIGNSSLTGTYMVLMSQEFREKQLDIAKRMTYIDLSSDPHYMDQYMSALFLPHTDSSLFPSVRLKRDA
jgi:uncharacterized 2Fe-2S/4Fe-4S cluster protein (DUF4445 family)